jgi:hypothetical protein
LFWLRSWRKSVVQVDSCASGNDRHGTDGGINRSSRAKDTRTETGSYAFEQYLPSVISGDSGRIGFDRSENLDRMP